ncbi:hypothetical protein FB567DRAFT_553366 [Paraphoma chrysanthemicola]|uniref:Uncharacterized protein n=1 Tax=Paraphoma chrysanthemicola TaxID=798071 RepID=A0A8K0QYJ3_9PLEO|nr:hypothetical protein FB567DRAFT_553366 [Paraphoma chrysanthemicola]
MAITGGNTCLCSNNLVGPVVPALGSCTTATIGDVTERGGGSGVLDLWTISITPVTPGTPNPVNPPNSTPNPDNITQTRTLDDHTSYAASANLEGLFGTEWDQKIAMNHIYICR